MHLQTLQSDGVFHRFPVASWGATGLPWLAKHVGKSGRVKWNKRREAHHSHIGREIDIQTHIKPPEYFVGKHRTSRS